MTNANAPDPSNIERLYVAHPKSTYGTEREAQAFAQLAELFPDAELLNPASMFESNADWLRRYRIGVERSDLVVVITDARLNWIGLGVVTEVLAAFLWAVPVVVTTQRMFLADDRRAVTPFLQPVEIHATKSLSIGD